jgi:UDP-galactose transporter
VLGIIGVFYNDGAEIVEKGVFFGYTPLVISCIFVQAVGGLVVGIVVKYADNILKGFSTAVAIIVSCIFSVYFFNFKVSFEFLLGASFVISAIYLYSIGQTKKHTSLKGNSSEEISVVKDD